MSTLPSAMLAVSTSSSVPPTSAEGLRNQQSEQTGAAQCGQRLDREGRVAVGPGHMLGRDGADPLGALSETGDGERFDEVGGARCGE